MLIVSIRSSLCYESRTVKEELAHVNKINYEQLVKDFPTINNKSKKMNFTQNIRVYSVFQSDNSVFLIFMIFLTLDD